MTTMLKVWLVTRRLHNEIVLKMWARKQMEKDGLKVRPIGEYVAKVNKKRNSSRKGLALMLTGIFLLFVTAYFCLSKNPAISATTVVLAIADMFLIFLTIARGAWLYLVEQVPEADEVVKRLVSEYFELRELLKKGNLWGDYIKDALEDGTFEANFQFWKATKLEKLPRTLVDEAVITLHRLGKRVARCGPNKPHASRSTDLKTKRLIPAFRAAAQVGATDGSSGYGRFIPKVEPQQ